MSSRDFANALLEEISSWIPRVDKALVNSSKFEAGGTGWRLHGFH